MDGLEEIKETAESSYSRYNVLIPPPDTEANKRAEFLVKARTSGYWWMWAFHLYVDPPGTRGRVSDPVVAREIESAYRAHQLPITTLTGSDVRIITESEALRLVEQRLKGLDVFYRIQALQALPPDSTSRVRLPQLQAIWKSEHNDLALKGGLYGLLRDHISFHVLQTLMNCCLARKNIPPELREAIARLKKDEKLSKEDQEVLDAIVAHNNHVDALLKGYHLREAALARWRMQEILSVFPEQLSNFTSLAAELEYATVSAFTSIESKRSKLAQILQPRRPLTFTLHHKLLRQPAVANGYHSCCLGPIEWSDCASLLQDRIYQAARIHAYLFPDGEHKFFDENTDLAERMATVLQPDLSNDDLFIVNELLYFLLDRRHAGLVLGRTVVRASFLKQQLCSTDLINTAYHVFRRTGIDTNRLPAEVFERWYQGMARYDNWPAPGTGLPLPFQKLLNAVADLTGMVDVARRRGVGNGNGKGAGAVTGVQKVWQRALGPRSSVTDIEDLLSHRGPKCLRHLFTTDHLSYDERKAFALLSKSHGLDAMAMYEKRQGGYQRYYEQNSTSAKSAGGQINNAKSQIKSLIRPGSFSMDNSLSCASSMTNQYHACPFNGSTSQCLQDLDSHNQLPSGTADAIYQRLFRFSADKPSTVIKLSAVAAELSNKHF